MRRIRLFQIAAILLCILVCAITAAGRKTYITPQRQAGQILSATGVKGGLIVHLGCGDGKLTVALHAGDNYTVQGLDPDAKNIETARKHVHSLGLYGRVSVNHLTSSHLPYVDNLVTLLVSENAGGIGIEEIMRVLAPLGIAYVKQGNQWTKTVKPWPKDIDEWQQHFHDADNNAVANDSVVGPPRHYQWIAEPQWMRSHMSMPSISSLVSSKGRLFTIEDLASAEHPALPGKFALVARDAFNGIVLWQRLFPDWHPVNIRTKETPVQLQRRLAAIGDIVYCTPSYGAPVTAFDAATGKVLKEYEQTERTTEFLYDRGVLYVVIGDPTDTQGIAGGGTLGTSQFPVHSYGPIIAVLADPKSTILAIEAGSGRTLWQKLGDDTAGYQGASLAIRGNYAVFSTARDLVCLDRVSGQQVWRVPDPITLKGPGGIAVSLVLSDDAAYLADSERLRAFRLADGQALWEKPATINHHKAPDVFLANGLVWAAAYSGATGRPAPELGLTRMGVNGFDPETGKLVKQIDQTMLGPMGHDRCYRNRITTRYYINSVTGGSDFLDLSSSTELPNPWVRSTCGIGPLPCNGLYYAGPPACSCCNWVMLNALNALAPEPGLKSSGQLIKVETNVRLEKGPAYEQIGNRQSAIKNSFDWPTYRYDIGRTGVTKAEAPAELKPRWEAKVTTRASAPVIAAGKVFVADIDAHAVCALDASDGRSLWQYTTGARVDSPPTYHEGLLLFGSRDGWVYALRASDGVLAWRFRGLPDRDICAYEQVESAWPICGSVLIKDGVAYFAAGRNSFLDGGIFLYGLDPQTGQVIHQRRMYGPYNDEGFPIITSQITSGSGLDGFKADIFLTDGELLYLRQQAFKADLTPLGPQEPRPPHLIPSAGFLEAIPHHRTFWTIDTTIRYDITAGKQAAHGDILVIDGEQFYEVRGYTPARISPFDPRPGGYSLFAGVYSQANKTAAQDRGRKKAPDKVAIRSVAEQRWISRIPLTGKALVLAGDTVFVAGTPVAFPADDLAKAYEGRMGGILWAASASTGEKVAECKLDAPPVWDGMAVANGRLFISLQDGCLMCLGDK
jgi:outer membrane protein assembly factor BamB